MSINQSHNTIKKSRISDKLCNHSQSVSLVRVYFNHIRKKQKDSLETQSERAVLHAYAENQVTLEPNLPYRASKM